VPPPRKKKAPRAAIFDAQSVQVANHPGERGYDAGKKIRGGAERSETDSRRLPEGARRRQPRSTRHLVVDPQGLILGVAVTPASLSDRAGALEVLPAVPRRQRRLELLWADAGSAGGTLAAELAAHVPTRGLRLEIVKRSDPAAKGFVVQPRRWVVERTFGWLMQARRLARDYETNPASSVALILAQASRIMLRRLAR
jgi:transposase